jgi:hypothetical protein
LIFIIADYNNFNLKKLETAYRQFLTTSREAIRDRIIKYILDNGLFNDVSDEVQAAVISLINDTFMDKIQRYMESRLQMLRIGQSADIIATQTPKSAPSGVAPPISAEQQLATQSAKFRPSAQPVYSTAT